MLVRQQLLLVPGVLGPTAHTRSDVTPTIQAFGNGLLTEANVLVLLPFIGEERPQQDRLDEHDAPDDGDRYSPFRNPAEKHV